ncbi:glycosyltransferase family 2 protein [Effusibacillus dendaii]|uniref:Glycosyl transferase n=1 Tax=Effusibacillus dendaii TaxID=2743772 RepID=A0A7I8D6U0_9BACL|nr:glycosyltransferase family 2 protein [Effusibacillus dendaii]BCJ85858.1 glycosyl transferase [Effusibacillus dendaii]
MKTGVVVPAYNEAESIAETIRYIRMLPEVDEILVVDDGSSDKTASEAIRAGARVVWHQQNFGKGQALKTAFQSIQSEMVVLLDADIKEGALELRKLIDPVLRGDADMTIAAFPPAVGKQGFGIVKGVAKWGIYRTTGFSAHAPLSGQRAFRKELIQHLNLADGYGVEVAMTIDALRAGYRLLEVPVHMKNREYGRTWKGFCHRGRQFVHILRALLERGNDPYWEVPEDSSTRMKESDGI